MERNTLSFTDDAVNKQLHNVQHILKDIDSMLDWTSTNSLLKVTDCRNKSHYGRDCFAPETMFRILIVKELYSMSDRQTEESIRFNYLFKWFCKLSFDAPVPDHVTIGRWRERFIEHDIYEKVFNDFYQQLQAHGYNIKTGSIVVVDATLIKSAARPRKKTIIDIEKPDDTSENKDNKTALTVSVETSKDPDAAWKTKGNKYEYGYQETIATDKNGVIMYVDTTPANHYEGTQLIKVIDTLKPSPETMICADKGYSSEVNREYIIKKKLKDGVMIKKEKNKDMSEENTNFNKSISKYRFVVERTFGTMKRRLSLGRSIYFGLKKTHNRNIFLAFIHNLIRAPKLLQESCV